MTMQERLVEATIKELTKKEEASYSRIYQHTQDDSTFAIIGSEDKDTGDDRFNELVRLVEKLTYKRGKRLGFNEVKGMYTYELTKDPAFEKSLILYDITKEEALNLAKSINQESIVWKDTEFFGMLYVDNGSVEKVFNETGKELPDTYQGQYIQGKFNNPVGKNMSFTNANKRGFGTRLPKDKDPKHKYGFTFEGKIMYPSGKPTSNEVTEEDFIFYGN